MNVSHQDVAITGLGLVCGLGATWEDISTNVQAGQRCFAPPTLFDASAFHANLAAQAPPLDLAGRAPLDWPIELQWRASSG